MTLFNNEETYEAYMRILEYRDKYANDLDVKDERVEIKK